MNNIQKLFQDASTQQILDALKSKLKTSDEAPFWKDKAMPFAAAVLSVLIPLRQQNLLFTPEGDYAPDLNAELFLEWMDLLSLKTLLFTIYLSNEASELLRTKVPNEKSSSYKLIDIEPLARYLSMQNVDLSKEDLDFPISSYNIHQGIKNIIKPLLQD